MRRPATFGSLLGLTLRDPGAAAGSVLALRLEQSRLFEALILVTVLGTLAALAGSGQAVVTVPFGAEDALTFTPLLYALLLGSALTVTAFAVDVVGRLLGGAGAFSGALTLVIWMEVVALVVRIAQILAFWVSPLLGTVVSLLGLGLLLWIFIHFIRVLHAFDGMGRAVAVLALAFLGIGFGLSLILALVGVGATAGV